MYALTNVRTMGSYLKINGLDVADLNSFQVQQAMDEQKLTKTVGGEIC